MAGRQRHRQRRSTYGQGSLGVALSVCRRNTEAYSIACQPCTGGASARMEPHSRHRDTSCRRSRHHVDRWGSGWVCIRPPSVPWPTTDDADVLPAWVGQDPVEIRGTAPEAPGTHQERQGLRRPWLPVRCGYQKDASGSGGSPAIILAWSRCHSDSTSVAFPLKTHADSTIGSPGP